MSQENRADDDLSFSTAMEELERILKGIEDERVDIDVLGRELGRAAELLELCRGKIRRAEVEVTQIVQSLEEAAEEPSEPADEEGELAEGEDPDAGELPF